jgi:hypothetical protein
VNRHYNAHHKAKYDKCEGTTTLAMLSDLKLKLSKQTNLFLKSATNERENLTCSYEVCLELVKHKKIFHRLRINQTLCDKNVRMLSMTAKSLKSSKRCRCLIRLSVEELV